MDQTPNYHFTHTRQKTIKKLSTHIHTYTSSTTWSYFIFITLELHKRHLQLQLKKNIYIYKHSWWVITWFETQIWLLCNNRICYETCVYGSLSVSQRTTCKMSKWVLVILKYTFNNNDIVLIQMQTNDFFFFWLIYFFYKK